jgi:DNA-binding transcriptional LysR family regulator
VAGHPGTGHAALVEHMCNALGGYAPDVRHRSDDVTIMRALVGSGRAVTLLPALIGTATPQVAVRPLAEGALRRTIFTAARAAGAEMPAVVAVRDALQAAAMAATAGRDDARVVQ